MILLIDNYDSFTFNLYQYIGTFTQDIKVVRNDKITIGEIESYIRIKLFFPQDRKVRRKQESVWMW